MKLASSLLAAAAVLVAAPAIAGPTITSVEIRNIDGIAGQGYLQIAELQLFGGATNYALTGTASATSVYVGGSAVPGNANDGSLNADYPNIYHGDRSDGTDVFTLTLAAPTAIDRILILGRNPGNCCNFRDIYSYTLLNAGTTVGTGTLDARSGSFATAAVPEPATWGMMLVGLGMVGAGLRYRRRNTTVRFA